MMNSLFSILFLIPFITFSQSDSMNVLVDTSGVYEDYEVDFVPEFPGGVSEMAKFIQENFEYTDSSLFYQENQKVWVEFIINQDGKISHIQILKGQKFTGNEMVRVISIMPNWKPGELNGVKVKVKYTLPITYCLH